MEDTGDGISEENLKKVFDPFFTTKTGKGSGLGLSVSKNIITMHKGIIKIKSKVGKGTKVSVALKTLDSERGSGFASPSERGLGGNGEV